jgi:hypothetical protein
LSVGASVEYRHLRLIDTGSVQRPSSLWLRIRSGTSSGTRRGSTVSLSVSVKPQVNSSRAVKSLETRADSRRFVDNRVRVVECALTPTMVRAKADPNGDVCASYDEISCDLGVIPWPLVTVSLTVVASGGNPGSEIYVDAFHIRPSVDSASDGAPHVKPCQVDSALDGAPHVKPSQVDSASDGAPHVKPSHVKPSHVKPSHVKPSQVDSASDGAPHVKPSQVPKMPAERHVDSSQRKSSSSSSASSSSSSLSISRACVAVPANDSAVIDTCDDFCASKCAFVNASELPTRRV